MRKVSRSALVPYTAAQMFALVKDVENYPAFLPWCNDAEVHIRGEDFIEASLPGTSMELELAEVVVHPHSELAGKTLAGAGVRQRYGIIIVALKRASGSTFNPGPDELIEAGDTLVALGPTQALERIEQASQ